MNRSNCKCIPLWFRVSRVYRAEFNRSLRYCPGPDDGRHVPEVGDPDTVKKETTLRS